MFAISRIAKVIGRIKILIDSINTINGIKTTGVPLGTKCANDIPGEVTQPNATTPTQRVTDILRGRMR
jgi:orotate phosphoribosyltransferase-like protein